MMNEIVRQVQKPISPNPQKRLLIVDDCDRTRAALKALLGAGKETAVFTLIEATNGQEAVELCQYNPPDLVLLDVNMPGVNGLQAAQLIKKEHPTIKIIMLSIDATYEAEAGAVGADAFLVKSGSPEVLLETIRKLIA